jgi:hypothetical protein
MAHRQRSLVLEIGAARGNATRWNELQSVHYLDGYRVEILEM